MSSDPAGRSERTRPTLFLLAGVIGVGAFASLAALAFPDSQSKPTLNAAAPAAPVRVVGAPDFSGQCAEQTWPHLAPQCITTRAAETAPPAKPAVASSGVALATPVTEPQPSTARNVPAAPRPPEAAIPPGPSTAVQGSPPPGAEPRTPGDLTNAPSDPTAVAPGTAAAAAIAAAAAAAAMPNLVGGDWQAKPRSERRRRAVRIYRTPRFNLRTIGFRF